MSRPCRLLASFAAVGCLAAAALLPFGGGCGTDPPPTAGGGTGTANGKGPAPTPPAGGGGDPSASFTLPGSIPDQVFYLDVYQVALPFGATSRNEDFWRYVDEERMPPEAKDLLQKNGVRAGLASNDDWEFFKGQVERYPHFARSGSARATGSGQIELPMKENVAEQLIFFVSDRAPPFGRTFVRCGDFFAVAFWPDPRRRAEMVLSISPVVRATWTERVITVRGDERSFADVRPEVLYDLNLRLNIPPERFLVLGLSSEGRRPSSLGHQFLTLQGGADLREQVLIFVPRIASARRPPATARSAPDLDAGRAQSSGGGG